MSGAAPARRAEVTASARMLPALMKEIDKDIENAGWSVPEFYEEVKSMPL